MARHRHVRYGIFFFPPADLANAAIVTQSGGIPLTIQCLSSPVRNTVSTKTCKVIDVFHSFDSTILILGHQTS